MASSLPHITNNEIGHNSIYGVAVFCRKDDGNDYLANQGGNENFNDEGEAANWENELESEDERFPSRRPISIALVESNNINHNGGEFWQSFVARLICGKVYSNYREAPEFLLGFSYRNTKLRDVLIFGRIVLVTPHTFMFTRPDMCWGRLFPTF